MLDDRIKQWHPFLYRCRDYEDRRCEITFTCPTCGGHNCEKLGDLDKDNFWSGHYRCTDCGETQEKGRALCYYSDAFTLKTLPADPVQLSIF